MTKPQLMPPAADLSANVGVLLYDKAVEVDPILTEAVASMRARGISVGGLLQRSGEQSPNGRPMMWIDDIMTGRTIRLDMPRGPGARACILDPDALAQAACWLRDTIETGVELIVVNRFGHAEVEGDGLRAEIAAAICAEAAILIAVRDSRLADLHAFLGGPASLLPLSADAIADWAEQAVAIRHHHAPTRQT